ncbi:hypothetical protein [Phyllobacterium myrsinacearum]|uniref:Tartrate dehydratase beta subunit/fumarate hydratase class I family protein n=1 Tax=Phyllobacterium myrsinacearum TaxID=28101 RepID=A0A839ES70_9HYPH|nr:hypothetical protein [Phyllobacterium myrsinacearum]MBA8881652.1 tartrate dehydratase beta subunit/fumarate hydratase class I family protein [Phyllobacterium myrsinacearum]
MILEMMVVVKVLGGAPGPEVVVHTGSITERDVCQSRIVKMNAAEPIDKFDSKGRPILSQTYKCLPISNSDIEDAYKVLHK